MRKWIRTCEICQRVKPSAAVRAPLQSFPIPTDYWESVSMDSVLGLPTDKFSRSGILVFVDRLSKMVHLARVKASISAAEYAVLFINNVFRHHGLPTTIASDRYPRFRSQFWTSLFSTLGITLAMSTTAHPETNCQTERANRVMEHILRSFASSYSEWSTSLPPLEFALKNSVHISTVVTLFFAISARHSYPFYIGLFA